MSSAPRTHHSFVVAPTAPYPWQAFLLTCSLIERGGVQPERITAHLVEGCDASVAASLGSLGINLRWVEPFGHPWCNKLQQLASLAAVEADRFVLQDTDMLVVRPLEIPTSGAILGKPVDQSLPPMSILEPLLREAGLVGSPAQADVGGGATIEGNLNGGLIVVPSGLLPVVSEAWVRWARWCLDRIAAFDTWHPHVDQVALAFAIAELHLPVGTLPRAFNVPTNAGPVAVAERPRLLHYHRNVGDQMTLERIGQADVDAAIDDVNADIPRWRRQHAVSHLFWAAQAAIHPAAGRKTGAPRDQADEPTAAARGRAHAGEEALIQHVMRVVRATSVTRIGPLDGITLGPVAPADLAICLDLLGSVANASELEDAVRHGLASGRVATILSGQDAPSPGSAAEDPLHEPLLELILRQPDALPLPIACGDAIATYVVVDARPGPNARDATSATLRRAAALGRADPLSLLECISASRRELGFVPDHLPRCLEYPWILERVRRARGGRLRIADVGAGVSVLPLLLADDGHHVTTIDSHPIQREDAQRDTWQEWGFLDYSRLRALIRSVHTAYEAFDAPAPFDLIYSVSVVEHLPAGLRRSWIGRMSRQLRSGGSLLLTVDLRPLSRDLWRWSEGSEVEDAALHGTLDDVLDELAGAGFAVEETEVIDWLPASRVGIAFIAARRVMGSRAVRASAADAVDPPRVLRSPTETLADAVTVLVPAYRSSPRFTGMLASMAAQEHRHLIVRVSIDHAPDAELPHIPPMEHVELQLVPQTHRLGWVGNVNFLLGTVATPYFMLVPHDDQLSAEYIRTAVETLEHHPTAVAAHGGLRFHGIRDGQVHLEASIMGSRLDRVRTYLERGPHLAGLPQRGVIRSEPLMDGVRYRTSRSDGQFANDLWMLEVLLYGETLSIDGIWYDKYTDPGGLSRVFHARSVDEKSEMLADSLGCLTAMVREHAFSASDQDWIISRYAEWLLGLQGAWNVVSDATDSDGESYRTIRPALSRFIARSLLSSTRAIADRDTVSDR